MGKWLLHVVPRRLIAPLLGSGYWIVVDSSSAAEKVAWNGRAIAAHVPCCSAKFTENSRHAIPHDEVIGRRCFS
jgi:hypothetical protein